MTHFPQQRDGLQPAKTFFDALPFLLAEGVARMSRGSIIDRAAASASQVLRHELQRRNFSEDTIRYYIRTVEDFARHFNCPPDRLGLQHIRKYQAELFEKRKLSSGTVTNYLAALRFFYIKTLKKAWSVAETPYPKKNYCLPTILTQEEVAQLIDAACTPFHRTMLMTLYATGLRSLS